MTTLRVLVSDDWPDRAEARWAVFDNGSITASGESGPSNWPRTTRTEAVLGGAQVGWAQARLPQAKLREQMRALPFAMEDQLLREPGSQHFTPVLREGEDWAVAVIARDRLRRLKAQFEALGRPLDAAWSALACLPVMPDGWTIAIDGQHWLVRMSSARALVDDTPLAAADADASSIVPAILTMSLEQARAQGTLPSSIAVMGGSDAVVAALASQGESVEVSSQASWPWYAVPHDAASLLHDEFQPAHARGQLVRAVRPALILVAVVLAVHLVLGMGSALLRKNDLKEMKSRMNQLARTQLPGRALQDPALQLHRELQTQRHRHGLLADDDALSLLSDVAIALGTESTSAVQALHYEGNTLVLTLAKPLDIPALLGRLELRGVRGAQRGGTTLALQRSTQ
jgi:general secretion pathway protein L